MQVKLLNSYAAFDYEIMHAGNSMFLLKLWRKDKTDGEPLTILLGRFLKMTIDEFTEVVMDYTKAQISNETPIEDATSLEQALETAKILGKDWVEFLIYVNENFTEEEIEDIEDVLMEGIVDAMEGEL